LGDVRRPEGCQRVGLIVQAIRMVLIGVNQGGGLRPSSYNTVVIMTRKQMTELIEARGTMLARVKRYGLYWNAIANVDIRQRTWAVTNAFRLITDSLKESNLLMEYIHEMPVHGLTQYQLDTVFLKMRAVHGNLDMAWLSWDAQYQEPRDIDARDTHLYEG